MTGAVPRVSVVMTVYNGARHLREAIDSILHQTFEDFEFLIVDDGSTDDTRNILAEYARADDRISILFNSSNLGPYPSANRALKVARAPLIARMDADDICDPTRLERQVAFLEAHTDHLLVGSGYRSIDESGEHRYDKPNPMTASVAAWTTRFRMPMVHPSFCFRAHVGNGQPVRYDEAFPVAQDYRLASQLAKWGNIAVLDGLLVDYRMHPGNISTQRIDEQRQAARQIAWEQVCAHYPPEIHALLAGFLDALYGQRTPTMPALREAIRGMNEAIEFDRQRVPSVQRWGRRRTAGMIAEAFLGQGGLARIRMAIWFVLLAPSLLAPLALRLLEVRGWIEQRPAPDG